jgi:hypothetical protein
LRGDAGIEPNIAVGITSRLGRENANATFAISAYSLGHFLKGKNVIYAICLQGFTSSDANAVSGRQDILNTDLHQ